MIYPKYTIQKRRHAMASLYVYLTTTEGLREGARLVAGCRGLSPQQSRRGQGK